MLSREEFLERFAYWEDSWNNHDLDGVMEFFHDEVVFVNWTEGRAVGKERLRQAWAPWFADHGGFRFVRKDVFFDEQAQKALYEWTLHWPSREDNYRGKAEIRSGVDVLHLRDGKIIRKNTYSKSTIAIEDKQVKMAAV
jgi:ketosteroid isomerase-like protein